MCTMYWNSGHKVRCIYAEIRNFDNVDNNARGSNVLSCYQSLNGIYGKATVCQFVCLFTIHGCVMHLIAKAINAITSGTLRL